jgi:Na+-transporting methylmalonyl-CoA/oxaloacetate decarboxylase gamma subunit
MNISFSNIFAYDFNVITFSLLGMAIVFVGLTVISLYITFLPKFLKALGLDKDGPGHGHGAHTPKPSKKKKAVKAKASQVEIETLLAIAVALHHDRSAKEDSHKLTWSSDFDRESAWHMAGKAAALNQRNYFMGRR